MSDEPVAIASPILALQNNILHAFENSSPNFSKRLEAAVNAGQLSPEIVLCDDLVNPRPPKVMKESVTAKPEIHLHVTHLELIWGFIYSWMILYEEGVQKPMLEGKADIVIAPKTPLMARAYELLHWVGSIAIKYTPWPQHLPSPIQYATTGEQWYGEKANLVFQQAVAFLLAHEFVHATSGHLDVTADARNDTIVLEMEKEADNAAFSILVDEYEGEGSKLSKGWAIMSVLLSSYLVRRHPHQPAIKTTHPPLHHRIDHLLRQLDFQTEEEQSYYQYLCSIVLRYVTPESLVNSSPAIYDTADEAFHDKLDQLDGLRSTNRRLGLGP